MNAFANNPLGNAMRTVPWMFPLGQILHFYGLCFLIGAIVLVDLRLLGFLKNVPIKAVLALIPIAIAGFALNAVTGLAFFTTDPIRYWANISFKLKMAAIVLAGLNAFWFTFGEEKRLLALPPGASTGRSAHITASLSLLFWFSGILFGRLLPIYEGF